MKRLNVPKDIKKYVFKQRIPYVIFFLALMALITLICISSKYIPPIGTAVGIIVAFVIFYDLPIFKNNLFDKTWVGEIVKVRDLSVELPVRGTSRLVPYRKLSGTFIMFTLKNKDRKFKKIISLPKNTPLNSLMDIYTPGSHVSHIGGTKQYVVFKETNTSYICPVCGIENPAENTHCFDCRHTLIKNLENNTST